MKVLGIGLSRTGTTSLHEALLRLGYSALHFPHPLEKISEVDAANDTPVAAEYKRLDVTYPESKFILTVRSDLDAWLESCKALWDSEFHKWPKHTHDLHAKLYGTKQYDRESLKSAYERHLQDVEEYFRDRTEDLLIMEVGDDSWDPLCRFLEKEIPVIAFPHRNSRESIGDGWDLGTTPLSDS